jgi:8-oxo-dGTP pyrophosphatase MutT (NUDIX family)
MADPRDIDLPFVTRTLEARAPRLIEGPDVERRAAVATVLRPTQAGLDVLLIRRAERQGDPWSGHMAFPGGGLDPRDRDLEAAAVRETLEEVGLPLDAEGRLLGRLDDVRATARGIVTGLVVSPFVFVVEGQPPLRTSDEVSEIHWAPLSPMFRGERDTSIDYVWQGQTIRLPGYRLDAAEGDRIVWGLTHKMLTTFFARLRGGL